MGRCRERTLQQTLVLHVKYLGGMADGTLVSIWGLCM